MSTDTPAIRGSSNEQTGLSVRQDISSEIAPSKAEAMARYEMEAAVVLAKKFPRNEDAAFGALMKSCSRHSFAEDALYSFPRGSNTVEGASIYLAKEAARVWGNIQYGCEIISDTTESRQIRAWAWDVQTNTRTSADDSFDKLIQRKDYKTKVTTWVKPDERDLRELNNKRASLAIRNCILSLVPNDLIEDAKAKAKATLKSNAAANIDENRKKVILAFGGIGISVASLEEHLGHPLAECSPDEIATLRTIWKSISDGNSTWSEYLRANDPDKANGNGTAKGAAGPLESGDLTGEKKPDDKAASGPVFMPDDAFDGLMLAELKAADDAAKVDGIRRNMADGASPSQALRLTAACDVRAGEIRKAAIQPDKDSGKKKKTGEPPAETLV